MMLRQPPRAVDQLALARLVILPEDSAETSWGLLGSEWATCVLDYLRTSAARGSMYP